MLRSELGTAGGVHLSRRVPRGDRVAGSSAGVDPGAYFRLLHQVRNPRVGDRIDTELPRRLREALPPVPEDAVHDAAQPLEDLEDHRRNVTALTQTDQALGSVLGTYRHYARRVLLCAAERAADAVGAARSAMQRRGRLRAAAEVAEAKERGWMTRHTTEPRAPGGRGGAGGVDRLPCVPRPAGAARPPRPRRQPPSPGPHAGRSRSSGDQARASGARPGTVNRSRLDGDLSRVGEDLRAADRHARAATVRLPLPAPPVLRTRPLGGGVDGADGDALAGVDVGSATDALRGRRQQVTEVTALLAAAETAAGAATAVRTRADDADRAAEQERKLATDARAVAEAAGQQHRDAVLAWADRLAAHAAAVPPAEPGGSFGWLPVPERPDPGGVEFARLPVPA